MTSSPVTRGPLARKEKAWRTLQIRFGLGLEILVCSIKPSFVRLRKTIKFIDLTYFAFRGNSSFPGAGVLENNGRQSRPAQNRKATQPFDADQISPTAMTSAVDPPAVSSARRLWQLAVELPTAVRGPRIPHTHTHTHTRAVARQWNI